MLKINVFVQNPRKLIENVKCINIDEINKVAVHVLIED
jgi:hypothetical protein